MIKKLNQINYDDGSITIRENTKKGYVLTLIQFWVNYGNEMANFY